MRAFATTAVQSRAPYTTGPVAPQLFLQRKCACGGTAAFTDECDDCNKKKLSGLQTKLKVSEPNDVLEREADRIADQVLLKSPTSKLPIDPLPNKDSVRQPIFIPDDASPSVHSTLTRSGSPMEPKLRVDMERRFGHDFSRVRIHTDADAARSAEEVKAHAFTVGDHVVFGASQFSPQSSVGKRLLAHELTHVVQQSPSAANRATATDRGSSVSLINRMGENKLLRKGFESTVRVCHRVLESRKFEVTKGGLRVALLTDPLDKSVPNCRDFDFGVTLTRSEDWWPDDEVGTCEATTGGNRSFSFSNLSTGTYYLTFWRNFDHPYCCLQGDLLVFDERVSSDSAGCRRDKDPSVMDVIHGALDAAGFIPVLGAIPDGLNALVYAAEGDWSNAGISAVAMVPAFGDGAKVVIKGGKEVIEASGKTVIRMGKDELAAGLKAEKAAAKKLEREAAERAAKEAEERAAKTAGEAPAGAKEGTKAEAKKSGEKKSGGGKYTCFGRSFVLQIPSALPEHKCPDEITSNRQDGPSVSASSEAAACLAAKHAFNAMLPRGCRPKHLKCVCSKR